MNNFYFWQKKNELNNYQREVRQYQARIVALENELITITQYTVTRHKITINLYSLQSIVIDCIRNKNLFLGFEKDFDV